MSALGCIGTDEGAFNVLKGIHVFNLVATNRLREQLGRL
jgi:hypothetical protein